MDAIIALIEGAFARVPLPVLQAWGACAYAIGLVLAVGAFGGFTFRIGAGLGRERQAWDEKAVLCIPVTFVSVVLTGYLGSFVVLVPGAQTFESLKDLVVLVCILLFGYPALITVPFAYALSDLIEGVPPGFLWDWLPGYFINPACFWIAHWLLGPDPDFRVRRTWWRYGAFVLAFMLVEPALWGHICGTTFTPAIAYRSVTPALVFTTGISWALAPLAMLLALPLARRSGMVLRPAGARSGLPIRMVLLVPFIALALLMVGATAYVALRSAEDDANKVAARLHEEIAANIQLELDRYLSRGPTRPAELGALLAALPASRHGLTAVVDRGGRTVASSTPAGDPVAREAVVSLIALRASAGQLAAGVLFRFDHVTAKPVARTTWLTRAAAFRARDPAHDGWIVVTAMPETYYLAGVRVGHSRAAMVFALALLLSVAAAALLAARVSDCLRQISRATESLVHGEALAPIPCSRVEELDTLARAFNGMAEQLHQSFDALRTSEDRLQLAVRAAGAAIWDWDIPRNRVVWDDAMFDLHGVPRGEFGGSFEEWAGLLLPEDLAGFRAAVDAALRGDRELSADFRIRRRDGEVRSIRAAAHTLRLGGKPTRMVGINWDVTERNRQECLLADEARILELVASGAPLPEVLAAIVRSIEAIAHGTIGSVLLLDRDGVHLRDGAGPGLPPEYRRAVDGMSIGPKAGSCGTATYRRETVVVRDIETDPLWEDYRDLVRPHGLRACWSSPILDARGTVLGTFALYYREPRSPRPDELALIRRASRLAGVAIERAALLAETQQRARALQALSQRLVTVQEEEWRRVSRELHDEIGQLLIGFKMKLEAARRGAPEPVAAALDQLVADARDLVARARNLALELRPSMLDDLGLASALAWHCESYSARTGIAVRLEHSGLERRFPGDLEIAAYRIVQEALTNVARHAGVDRAAVHLTADSGTLALEVEDHGRGFDQRAPAAASIGLSGMAERVAALGGRFEVRSAPGAGTRVIAELPL